MADDVCDAKTLVRVKLKHAGNQILELFTVEALGLALRIRVSLPKEIRAVGCQEFVKIVPVVGNGERRMTGVKDEENYTEGKKVNNLALVSLFQKDLRSHVAGGSDNRSVGTTAVTTI